VELLIDTKEAVMRVRYYAKSSDRLRTEGSAEITEAQREEEQRLLRETGLPILGTGSFYLVAEIRKNIKNKKY